MTRCRRITLLIVVRLAYGDPLYDVIVCGQRPGLVVTGRDGRELFHLTAPHELADAVTADTVVVHHEPTDDSGSLEPTMRWMRDHLGEPLTLADIARQAAVSPRSLNRRFHEQTGTTPLQWLLTQRVRHAQELLETTALSIEEIAGHCGFGTAINLRQHFTRRIHLSPQACRRAFQLR